MKYDFILMRIRMLFCKCLLVEAEFMECMSIACKDDVICVCINADLGAVDQLSSRAVKQIRSMTSNSYDPESVLPNPFFQGKDFLYHS